MLEMLMSRVAAIGLMLGIAALGACSDHTIVSAPEETMTIVAGDGQLATVGRPLPNPLTIAVRTSDGAGVADVPVAWSVTTGGGSLSASSVLTNAQGQASVTWTLGDLLGTQSVTASVTGAIGSPEVFSASAVGAPPPPGPIVLHYDGTAWSTALENISGGNISLASIWGATSSAVFAVGASCGNPLILRYDGTAWSPAPATCAGYFLSGYTSVWGNSASDVFATSRNGIPPRLGGSIDHYDGQQWRAMYAAPCPNQILCPAFLAVWSSSPTDAFAVGDRGMMAHYDGTNWSQQASLTTELLHAVWGVGPAGAVFTVGGAGTILYYDRSAWRAQTSGTTQPLNAVWGTSANDVFVVGGAGTILHYDGTVWTAQNSGTTQSLYGIWGTSGSDVFAVGAASTIIHYNGTSWTAQSTAASINLRGVWGSSPTNVFAVGAPR